MQQIPEHIDELIAVFLAGEASNKQKVELENWKNSSAENAMYFRKMEVVFNESNFEELSNNYDVDNAWSKVQDQIQQETKIVEFIPKFKGPDYKLFIRSAAVLLIIAGISWWISLKYGTEKMVAINANESVLIDTLSDGSNVVLNKNSSLQLASNFGKSNRKIRLKGEAYFKVQHKEDLPFLIDANGIIIEDIGTAFNVKAPDDSSYVEVIVEEGEVHFYREGTAGVHLKKGQGAIYKAATKSISIFEVSNPNITAYRTGLLDFNSTKLFDVGVSIERLYGVKVQMDSSIESCVVTVKFDNENLETVLNVISETMGLQIVRSQNMIAFKGKGCRN